MKTYTVAVPVKGLMYIEVNAESEQDALRDVIEMQWESDEIQIYEWEYGYAEIVK